jgi:hypothetical protein
MTARQSQFLAARTFTPTRSDFLTASALGFFGTLTPLATRQRTVGRNKLRTLARTLTLLILPDCAKRTDHPLKI